MRKLSLYHKNPLLNTRSSSKSYFLNQEINMLQHFLQQDTLLSTEELAKRTGFTTRFWEARRISGDTPPFIRFGCRAVRYRWNDVEKWLEDRIYTSTSDHGESRNNGGVK